MGFPSTTNIGWVRQQTNHPLCYVDGEVDWLRPGTACSQPLTAAFQIDRCTPQAAGRPIHTTRPKLPSGNRPGFDRNGFHTGHGPGRLAKWQLSDFSAGRKQHTADKDLRNQATLQFLRNRHCHWDEWEALVNDRRPAHIPSQATTTRASCAHRRIRREGNTRPLCRSRSRTARRRPSDYSPHPGSNSSSRSRYTSRYTAPGSSGPDGRTNGSLAHLPSGSAASRAGAAGYLEAAQGITNCKNLRQELCCPLPWTKSGGECDSISFEIAILEQLTCAFFVAVADHTSPAENRTRAAYQYRYSAIRL